MPDIDIDFCGRRRGEVIDYVTQRYGRENVAQIITFNTLAARVVTRDVGRAMEFPYAQCDNGENDSKRTAYHLESAIQNSPALQECDERHEKSRIGSTPRASSKDSCAMHRSMPEAW